MERTGRTGKEWIGSSSEEIKYFTIRRITMVNSSKKFVVTTVTCNIIGRGPIVLKKPMDLDVLNTKKHLKNIMLLKNLINLLISLLILKIQH